MPNYLGVSTDLDATNILALQAGSTVAVSAITVGASPFTYTATVRGDVNVAAGTVSAISITRGGVTTALGGIAGSFHASVGDKINITYSALPTVVFVPS